MEDVGFDFSLPPQVVAMRLLGMTLTVRDPGGDVSVRITETEAYQGTDDPASHAYRGRTARNEVMFGAGGSLYVYRSHGLHWCCNVVTGQPGTAAAVLLRAGEVLEGVAPARSRRGERVGSTGLARGPGNLASALGLTGLDNARGLDGDRVVLHGESAADSSILAGPRVGVRLAADVPWRYWLRGDPTVSAYRRSPRAEQPGSDAVGAEGIEPPTSSL